MIKSKDIRVGNFFKQENISIPRLGINSLLIDGNAYTVITAYGIHMVDVGKYKIEPIQLTENWLFAFGFKQINFSYELTTDMFNFYVNFYENHTNIAFVDTTSSNAIDINHIYYVHELQNLFHILTNEELILQTKTINFF